MINLEKDFKFNVGDKIVIGCSTGPDSMALLDMLLKLRDKYNLLLIVAHVNHNVRKESYDEAIFIKNYCSTNNLLFESMVIEEYGDDNFHNEARNIRYRFFESVVQKYSANYLMTAHHGDDLMETILMRMVRGSNLNGYAGFKSVYKMENYEIVRPLIRYTKKELEDYDIENNVTYFVDKSNLKDTYTRNRYRKYILPFLKSEEKDVHLKFLKFSNLLNDANRFIDNVTSSAIYRCVHDGKIIIDSFLKEDEFIQKEILYKLLSDFYQDDLILLNDKHISIIFELLRSKKSNGYINLPNEVLAKKEYNTLYFVREVSFLDSYEIEFDKTVTLPNNHIIERVDSVDGNSNYVCRLSSKDLLLPLIVRTRKLGDRMAIKGLNGTKKIKDIFIDKKVSPTERDSWPIVLDSSGNIVWIPGIIKSKYDKKIDEEYDIILKYK